MARRRTEPVRVQISMGAAKGAEASLYIGARARIRKLVPRKVYSHLKAEFQEAACKRWAEAEALAIVRGERDRAEFNRRASEALAARGGPTLRELAPAWLKSLAGNSRLSTIDTYGKHWRNHIAKHAIADIPVEVIAYRETEDFKLSLAAKTHKRRGSAKRLSVPTKNVILAALVSLLTYAVKMGHIASVPLVDTYPASSSVRPLDSEQYYTDDQVLTLLEAASAIDPMLAVAVLLGADAGCRLGEILGMQWQDLDLKARKVKILRQRDIENNLAPPKYNSYRRVDMTDRLYQALVEIGPEPTGDVLRRVQIKKATRRVGLVTRPIAQDWMLAISKAAHEIDPTIRVTQAWHRLRHTFATRLALATNGNLQIVKERCGHQSTATSERYCHGVAEGMPESILRAPGVTRKPKLKLVK